MTSTNKKEFIGGYKDNAKEPSVIPWQIKHPKALMLVRLLMVFLVPLYVVFYPIIRVGIYMCGYVVYGDGNYYFVYHSPRSPDATGYWTQKPKYWETFELKT